MSIYDLLKQRDSSHPYLDVVWASSSNFHVWGLQCHVPNLLKFTRRTYPWKKRQVLVWICYQWKKQIKLGRFSEFVNRLPFCERSAVLEYFGNSKRLFKIALLVDIAIGLIVQGVQLCIYTATVLSALKRVGYIRYIILSLM